MCQLELLQPSQVRQLELSKSRYDSCCAASLRNTDKNYTEKCVENTGADRWRCAWNMNRTVSWPLLLEVLRNETVERFS